MEQSSAQLCCPERERRGVSVANNTMSIACTPPTSISTPSRSDCSDIDELGDAELQTNSFLHWLRQSSRELSPIFKGMTSSATAHDKEIAIVFF